MSLHRHNTLSSTYLLLEGAKDFKAVGRQLHDDATQSGTLLSVGYV